MAVTSPQRMSLADLLFTEGLIDESQRDQAIEEYDRSKRSLIRILHDMGALSEDHRIEFLHRKYACPVVKLDDVTPRADVTGFLSPEMCRLHHVVPIRREAGAVLMAMEDPTDMALIGDLEKVFSATIKPVLATVDEILETIDRLPQGQTMEAAGRADEPSGLRKLVSSLFLVVLAFTPMIVSYYYIMVNAAGQEWYASFGLTRFETGLVFMIAWGSWAAIAYFINDLLFGRKLD